MFFSEEEEEEEGSGAENAVDDEEDGEEENVESRYDHRLYLIFMFTCVCWEYAYYDDLAFLKLRK